MATKDPFLRIFSTFSAWFPQTATLCHWVSVTFSPLLLEKVSLVATVNVASFLPLSKVLTSGSFPRFPMIDALFF